jgi:hypothetical protein
MDLGLILQVEQQTSEGHEHSPGSVKISVRKNLDISDQTHTLASTLSLDGKEDTRASWREVSMGEQSLADDYD